MPKAFIISFIKSPLTLNSSGSKCKNSNTTLILDNKLFIYLAKLFIKLTIVVKSCGIIIDINNAIKPSITIIAKIMEIPLFFL